MVSHFGGMSGYRVMKLIYVAGIEHCGSTLTDFLLSRHPTTVGLGEVASFFSPVHMQWYLREWGELPDAKMCSCGKVWADCEVWGPLAALNGAGSDLPMIEKYSALLQHLASLYGNEIIAIDSSKSLATLTLLADNDDHLGLSFDDLLAVLAIKDVRSFAASMLRKEGAANSLRGTYSIFKRWLPNSRRRWRGCWDKTARHRTGRIEGCSMGDCWQRGKATSLTPLRDGASPCAE
jgi:hypothetical protein